MYAVIETGGKQYQVKEGDIVFIEKLEAEGEITFDKVIMVGKDDGVKVGAPYVDGASVRLLCSRTASPRRSPFSPTSPRRAARERWATDSRTAR